MRAIEDLAKRMEKERDLESAIKDVIEMGGKEVFLNLKISTCREILDHLSEWFDGATLDPIRLKGMVGVAMSDFHPNSLY